MGEGLPVASSVEWFSDDRAPVRRMKASWHSEVGVVVLSLWQGDHCTGTFRLPIADAPGLMHLLVDALAEAPRPPEPPARTRPWQRLVGLMRRRRPPLAPVLKLHP
jgi:hypothetical protein